MYLVLGLQSWIFSFQMKMAIVLLFSFVFVFEGTGLPIWQHLLLHYLFSAT